MNPIFFIVGVNPYWICASATNDSRLLAVWDGLFLALTFRVSSGFTSSPKSCFSCLGASSAVIFLSRWHKIRFEGFQFVFLAPCAGGDGLKCRQIHTEFFQSFLI